MPEECHIAFVLTLSALLLVTPLQIPQVPEEWYTCCGLEPPDPSLPIYPSMLLDAESAAAVADSLAGLTGQTGSLTGLTGLTSHGTAAVGSPRQHAHSLHQHAGSFKSCSSCSAQHGSSSGEAAAAVEEVLEELTAAVESSSDHQQEHQQQPQQQKTQQDQQQQQLQAVTSAVPRQPGAMLYPGVVSERLYPQLQLRELMLANGMRLAIKETDFLADEVLVTAVAVGGLSEVRPQI